MEVFHTGYLIFFHHFSPVAWEPIEFLCKGSGTKGESEQNAGERCFGDCRDSGSGVLQLAVSCAECDRRMRLVINLSALDH